MQNSTRFSRSPLFHQLALNPLGLLAARFSSAPGSDSTPSARLLSRRLAARIQSSSVALALWVGMTMLSAFPLPLLALRTGGTVPAASSGTEASVFAARIADDYGKLPISFETNAGQADARVKFVARGSGYGLYLNGSEAVLALRASHPGQTGSPLERKIKVDSPFFETPEVVRMRLIGARPDAQAKGVAQLPGKANYFVGNDPSKWRSGVPTYGRAQFDGVYPGVDVVYYGNQGQLEYDFDVAAHADPGVIALAIEGAGQAAVDELGNLVIHAPLGPLVFHRPVAYQTTASGARELVDADYRIGRSGHVSFQLGRYDHGRVLVIDPSVTYSTFLGGGSLATYSKGIAVDAHGSAYITGVTAGLGFPTTSGTYQSTDPSSNPNANTVFVSKLSADGSSLEYSTFVSAADNGSVAEGIAVDAQGDAFVGGETYSLEFPTTAGAYQSGTLDSDTFSTNTLRAFVFKLNSSGSALVYSTLLHGASGATSSQLSGLQIDSSGDAYVIGSANAGDYPTTAGVYQPANSLFPGPFLTKLNPAGSGLVYSTYAIGDTTQLGLAVDGAGNTYVAGLTTDVANVRFGNNSYHFVTTSGAYQADDPWPAANGPRGFIAKFNSTASALVFSTVVSNPQDSTGSVDNEIESIALDSSDNVYFVGNTASPAWPVTAGAFQKTIGGGSGGVNNTDAFVGKLKADGSGLAYTSYLGGAESENGAAIGVDSTGQAVVSVHTFSTDFPCTAQHVSCTFQGNTWNATLSIVNSAGTSLAYSSYLGSDNWGGTLGNGTFLTLDAKDNIYVTGATGNANFPITSGAFQTIYPGSGAQLNSFVMKLQEAASTVPVVSLTPASLSFGSQRVDVASTAKTVTLKNTGSGALTISSVAIAGTDAASFSETDGCGSSLDAGASCTISVIFTPASVAALTATLTVADNASGSPQTVTLSGTGTAAPVATAVFSPTSLAFGDQAVGTASTVKTVTLTNTGGATLTLSAFVVSGAAAFSETNNCGDSLNAGHSCTVSIIFAPQGLGADTATLDLDSNTESLPPTVAMTGTGVAAPAPVVTLTPGSLAFGNQTKGTSSTAQTIDVKNIGTANLTNIVIVLSEGTSEEALRAVRTEAASISSANYSATTTCGTSLDIGASCAVSVIFTPTTTGALPGTLTISDNASGSPQTATLTGTGTAPVQGDFTVSSSPAAASVKSGGSAQFHITVGTSGGPFNSAINLTVSGLPAGATATFSPASVTPGAGSASSTLTIQTGPSDEKKQAGIPFWPAGSSALALVLFAIPKRMRRQWSRRLPLVVLMLASLSAAAVMIGCGGGFSLPHTATTSTITVTATSGADTHTTTVQLTVN